MSLFAWIRQLFFPRSLRQHFNQRSKRSRASTAPSAPELLDLLAAATRHPDQLLTLCREHHEAIVQYFSTWQMLPEDIRTDKAKSAARTQLLVDLAIVFEEKLDDPILRQFLAAPCESFQSQWPTRLLHARELASQLRYDDAIDLLTSLLTDAQQFAGPGADHHLALTHGLLAHCLLDSGQAERALPHFESALKSCRDRDDADGVRIYLHALYENHRYLGITSIAANYADQFAEDADRRHDPNVARRYRNYARVARDGEPLNRVVVHIDKEEFELSDVPDVHHAPVRFVFRRNRPTLALPRALVEQGEKLAATEQFEPALEKLQHAARIDPFDPDPHFKSGLVLLLLERYDEAIEAYERAETLAPGWHTCRADLHLARLLSLGRITHDIFLDLRTLEASGDPREKLPLARRLLARAPDLPAAHLAHARLLIAVRDSLEASKALEAGLNIDPDTHSRLQLQLALLHTDPPRDGQSLQALRQDTTGNLIASAIVTLAARSRTQSADTASPEPSYNAETQNVGARLVSPSSPEAP